MNIETTIDNQPTCLERINFVEIRVYGLIRSGNPALIEWIQNEYAGRATCFLNNVKHGGYDSYTNYEQKILTGTDERAEVEIFRAMKNDLLNP